MVDHIRADLRLRAPRAVTPALERALAVIGRIRREEFIPHSYRKMAYFDTPLPIEAGQTISDPFIVAVMTAALDLPPDANVLDVGTGSGYQAAVLAPLAKQVYSVEIVAELAAKARQRLKGPRYRNVTLRIADGFAGWPEHAPFDGIVVAAGAARIPQPLLDQLKPGGRLVMPVGSTPTQEEILLVTRNTDGSFTRCSLGPARFVPLVGQGSRQNAPAPPPAATEYCHGAPVT